MNKFIEVDRLGFSLQVSHQFDLKTCEDMVFITLVSKVSNKAYRVTVGEFETAKYMVEKINEVLDKCIEGAKDGNS